MGILDSGPRRSKPRKEIDSNKSFLDAKKNKKSKKKKEDSPFKNTMFLLGKIYLFSLLPMGLLSGKIFTSIQEMNSPDAGIYDPNNELKKGVWDFLFNGFFTIKGFFLTSLFCFLIIFFVFVIIKAKGREPEYEYDEERGIKIAKTSEYGNEHFLRDDEIKQYFHVSPDPRAYKTLILGTTKSGEIVFIDENHRKANKNILILGSAGTGKSRAFARSSVLQTAKREESLIVTDPKGELFADTYKYLCGQNYDVKVLNLKDITKSDCWDMLDVIIQADDVDRNTILQSVSEIIVTNSSDKKDSFASSAQSLLTSFLYLLVFADEVPKEMNFLDSVNNTVNFEKLAISGRKVINGNISENSEVLSGDEKKLVSEKSYRRTFSTVYEVISLFSNDLVDAIFSGLNNEHPAKKSYMTFSKTSPNLKGNIYQNLAAMLQLFSNKEVANIFDGIVECLCDDDCGKNTSSLSLEQKTELKEKIDSQILKYEEFIQTNYSSDKKLKPSQEEYRDKILEQINILKKKSRKYNELEISEIRKISNIDILSLAKHKTALFVIMSDQNTTYNFLSSIFFNLFFEVVVKYIDSTMDNGEPSRTKTINCILDEFANIGRIPGFDKKISTVRSRKIHLTIILQTITQLMNLYPDKVYSTILGNCGLTIFLGASEEETATFISNQAGSFTSVIESQSRAKNALNIVDYQPEYRESSGLGRRELLTPQEVIKKPYEELYILFTGYGILKLNKYFFDYHPDSKQFEFFNIKNYTPLRSKSFNELQTIVNEKRENLKDLDVSTFSQEDLINIENLTDTKIKFLENNKEFFVSSSDNKNEIETSEIENSEEYKEMIKDNTGLISLNKIEKDINYEISITNSILEKALIYENKLKEKEKERLEKIKKVKSSNYDNGDIISQSKNKKDNNPSKSIPCKKEEENSDKKDDKDNRKDNNPSNSHSKPISDGSGVNPNENNKNANEEDINQSLSNMLHGI